MSGKARGRPLRFFLLLVVGWIGLRAAMLAAPPGVARDAVPPPVAVKAPDAVPSPNPASPVVAAHRVVEQKSQQTIPAAPVASRAAGHDRPVANRSREAVVADVRIAMPDPIEPATPYSPPHDRQEVADPPVRPAVLARDNPGRPSPDRWQLGAWAFWRSGSGAAPLATQGGRLGGSQVGARVDYDLIPGWAGRLAPYARITSALDRPASPEAAMGLAYQPSRLVPLSLLAERRLSLGKGGRDATALFIVGGFGPTRIAHGIHAEAYGQAGMVGFSRRDMVVDGKLALLRAFGRSPLSAGLSLSGGAQPGVGRIDIGPEIRLRLPLPNANARLSVEWRQQLAGEAKPGSGLAVTLASDF